jgi:hypothetical protein
MRTLPCSYISANSPLATGRGQLVRKNVFQKAKIEVKSSVVGVENATVRSTPVAVGNNASISIRVPMIAVR